MGLLLAGIGALLGFAFASTSSGFFGAVFGAAAGFTIAEVLAARRRITDLEFRLERLWRTLEERTRTAKPAEQEIPREQARGADDVIVRPPPRQPEAAPAPSTARPAEPPAREFEPVRPSAPSTADAERPAAADGVGSGGYGEPAVIRLIREYFTGGNTLVRVGVVILFIGMAFLLRYVTERTRVPIEFRLAGVALVGVVLLVLGWRLRVKRLGYALALQGGGIGILYLTVFTSLRLFHVMPPGPAFALLIVISALSAALAVLQNSMAFALLGIGCGFLAPILASTGQGDHVLLFSYYLVLNLGILAIAWFKAWKLLNTVGFLFTFVIGTAWGVLRYRSGLFATTEPFLIAFFLLYLAIAVLFSLRQQPSLRGYVDGTLVFGVPIVAFSLQSAMVHDRPFAMAYSAATVSAIYLVLAWLLHRGQRETQRLLVEAFLALGIAFATLAVPLALDGRWSAATWALEGAALIWVGCRQSRLLARASGALLLIGSGLLFLFDSEPYGGIPILNSGYLGGLMIALASVYASHVLRKNHEFLRDHERFFSPVLFFWGLLWWLASGAVEIVRHVPDRYIAAGILAFITVSALLSSQVDRRLAVIGARVLPLALLPVMVLFAFVALVDTDHPFDDARWAAWAIAFAGFCFLRRRDEERGVESFAALLHTGAALLLVALLTWELAWQIDRAVQGGGSWPAIAWSIVPALALLSLPKLAGRFSWPCGAHEQTYVVIAGGVIAIYLALWSLVTNVTMAGDPYPLPYVPLLNPLDVAQAFVLIVIGRYTLHLHRAEYPLLSELKPAPVMWSMAGILFIWLNAILLRTLHHWSGVPYEPDDLFASTLVQTSLTIFWTVIALVTMLIATRKSVRVVWIVGACLMAVVIAKLFLIDLSRIGTIERIVSFVGVGVLMLVVGYLSPLPPARKEASEVS
ncbi:MAG TPA: DUF2339 domain-containing protein [Steroidobacteraceae bacterium]